MKFNIITALLIFIICLSIFLRFSQLGGNPPSLTWDEAAWGYNAYTLGVDGKDEFGRFLPITYLESFGDYKPPLYAYLSVLPVKLFGLTEFSTRFASAFFGVLTVLLTYFLTKEIFRKNTEDKKNKNTIVALLASFLMSISPWHIMLSRAAFEANVATFFIVFGVYLFLVSERRLWFFLFSMVSFVLSLYTFNTARLVTPLIVCGLIIAKRNMFFPLKLQHILGVTATFVIFLPLAFFLATPQAKLRFQEVNIFSDPGIVRRVNQETKNDNNALWSKIIHNRRFAYSVEYLRHYLDNLSPLFLFIKGDGNPKFSIQDVGELYLWEIPFLVAGILLLLKNREGNWWIVPFWLLVGIIPAATARETPHALRIEATLPTFQILSAYGLSCFIFFLEEKRKILLQNAGIGFVTLAVFVNFLYFYHNYTNHYAREFSGEWQYGYKDAISYITEVQDNYSSVYFTDALGRPYIYLLFYMKYSPEKFRAEIVNEKNVTREVIGFVHVNQFDKYVFTKKDIGEKAQHKKILYIDIPSKVPRSAQTLKTFYLLNGEEALTAYTL